MPDHPAWDASEAVMTSWVLAQLDLLDAGRVAAGDDGRLLLDVAAGAPEPRPQEPARRGRGRPAVPQDSLGRLTYIALAAHDVDRIRALWHRVYGRKNRDRDDAVKAETIAAQRWGVTFDSIVTYRAKPNNRRPDRLIVGP